MTPDPNQPSRSRPQHVAIIMDGNGRWAERQGLPRNEGHRAGVRNVEHIVEQSRDLDLRFLTLYAFSVENWNRPRLEVEALMQLLVQFLKKQRAQLLEHHIRLRVLGRLEELPARVRSLLEQTIEETASFDRWNLSLCLNYGSRTEVVDAVRRYSRDVTAGTEHPDHLDWKRFSRYLYTADIPDPDLVIRTSGETRVSNFLLMQSAYAEYLFVDKLWPEFGPQDLAAAIDAYQHRERRFGMTGQQLRDAVISPTP